ncbi:MAG TPA: SDR family oxidoreductase [Steroidobacteraceae bacterium]|nr:SDR family oxidoreductase [Steroidobacteraceae bacterium]
MKLSAGDAPARVALVSGAASGLGLATTAELARRGWTVLAGYRPRGRSAPPAAPFPGARVHWLPLDITDAAARTLALKTLVSIQGRLDALVHSAGVLGSGPLEEVPEDTLRTVMEVNFFATVALTRTFLPLMREQRSGVIAFLSSLSGLIARPFDGAYAASKHALEAAAESLRHELAPFGIRVALIEPGAYATALREAGSPAAQSAYPEYAALRTRVEPRGQDPAEAARLIVEVIESGAPELRVPCGAQAMAVAEKLRLLDGAARAAFALEAAGITR